MPADELVIKPFDEIIPIPIEEFKDSIIIRLKPARDLWWMLGFILIGVIFVTSIFGITLVGNIEWFLFITYTIRMILDVLFRKIVCYEIGDLYYTDLLNRTQRLEFSDITDVELRDVVQNKWNPFRGKRDIQYATLSLANKKFFKFSSNQPDYRLFMKLLRENGVNIT